MAVHFAVGGRRWQWGATAAFACGVAAAFPLPAPWWAWGRMVLAWFVAVPLLGGVWAPALGAERHLDAAAWWRRWKLTPDRWSARGVWLGRQGRRLAQSIGVDASLALLLALAAGAVLGSGVAGLVAAAAALVGLVWLVQGHPPGAGGWVRAVLEILLPTLIGWLALHGAASVPAPIAVNEGIWAVARTWLEQNWLLPGVAVAFAVVYHGATNTPGRGRPALHRWQVAAGYLVAIALLVLAGRPLHAGAVALLFAVQWPFQALELGPAWHWQSTQVLAFAAMLAAALGAR